MLTRNKKYAVAASAGLLLVKQAIPLIVNVYALTESGVAFFGACAGNSGWGMKVDKVINNNLVRSINEKGQEVLVMGSGLGFKKKPGDSIDQRKIEKIYILSQENGDGQRLGQLLARVPVERIRAANEIISYARDALGKQLNDNIYLTLTDHVSFAIERTGQGIVVRNALLWEIKRFYHQEYLVGLEALNIIKNRLGVELPEDEAGFIALHLVNASMESMNIGQTQEMTKMIQNIINIVKYHFRVELDESSLHYGRFVTHLKFFAQRVFTDTEMEEDDKNFLQILKEKYKEEYQCALKIRSYTIKEYQKDLTEDELVYLTVHIKRVTME